MEIKILRNVTGDDDTITMQRKIQPSQCMPGPKDYTFMWWANGWRGEKIRCYQTGYYGMAMDTINVRMLHFGSILDCFNNLVFCSRSRQTSGSHCSLNSAKSNARLRLSGESSYHFRLERKIEFILTIEYNSQNAGEERWEEPNKQKARSRQLSTTGYQNMKTRLLRKHSSEADYFILS